MNDEWLAKIETDKIPTAETFTLEEVSADAFGLDGYVPPQYGPRRAAYPGPFPKSDASNSAS